MTDNQGFFAKLAAVIFTTATITAAGPAVAQELEEIVVTAQRREQSLQEVPISLEAISGQDLLDQGYRTMDDLAEFSPSIEIDVRMQDQNVSIRGMGTTGSSLALEQSAPTFVDGVVMGRTSIIKGALMDVERIEVLRGPQPVYFGQNAVAGAFSIITRKPSETWQGDVQVEVGNFGRRTVEGGVGGPITDTLGIRVAGKYDELAGYLTDVVTDDRFPERRDRSGRVTLQWQPSDAFSATAKLGYTDTDAGSEATVVCLGRYSDLPVSALPLRVGLPFGRDALVPGRTSFNSLVHQVPACGTGNSPFTRLGLKSQTVTYDPLPGIADQDTQATSVLNIRDTALRLGPQEFGGLFDAQDWYDTSLDLTYRLANDIELASLTGFVDYYRSGVETSTNSVFFDSVRIRDEDLSQISQEFRVTSPTGGMFEWMLGAYWQKNDLDLFMDNFSANMRRPRRLNMAWEDAEWQSLFAALTFNFMGDKASIDVGGRYSSVEKTTNIEGFGARYVFAAEPVGGCAANARCRTAVTSDGLPGYTLLWNTRPVPANWSSPTEPIGVTALDPAIRAEVDGPGEQLQDSLKDSEFDPQVVLRYRFNEDLSTYAKYATAFKAGGFDTAVATLAPNIDQGFGFGPEQAEIWEVGAKGEFWDGRGRYDTALFNLEISDLQIATTVTDVSGQGVANIAQALNAGKQRVRGFEFTLEALLTENLQAQFAGALMDGEMVLFEGAGCTEVEFADAATGPCVSVAESTALTAGLRDASGNPVASDAFAGTIDRSGYPAPRTPDWKFALKLDYSRPIFTGLMYHGNMNLGVSDGYITNVEEFDLVQKAGKHADMNLSAGIGDADGRWRFSLWARNLFGVQEEYNPEFDLAGDGIVFDDAAQSFFTSYGVQFRYNYQ